MGGGSGAIALYKAAYDLAVAARLEMLANAKDKPYLKNPLAKKNGPETRSRFVKINVHWGECIQ
jgi:hypothetical protein